MFGYGYIKKWEAEVERLQELIDKVCFNNAMLSNKVVELMQTLTSEEDKVTALNNKILELTNKKRPRRKNLSHRTGFTRVSKDDSLRMYQLYRENNDLHEISRLLDRSHSCVSSHIRKQLEEENNESKQMGDIPRRETEGIKE